MSSLGVLLALADRLDVEVVQRDAPLEEQREQRVVDRLAEVDGVPLLVARHPQDAVADVVVVAEHVGELVVDVVVRVLPLLGRLGRVPLPVAGVDLRIVHPVPLAVHRVVAELHVLQDLGRAEQRRAEQPRGREEAREQRDAAGGGEAALQRDDAQDVVAVGLAAGGLDLGADLVELGADRLDLFVGQVGVLTDVGECHGGLLR